MGHEKSGCRGEGFFEDGLEEVGGVGAGTLDLGFEFAAGGHEGFDPLYDGGLLIRWRDCNERTINENLRKLVAP